MAYSGHYLDSKVKETILYFKIISGIKGSVEKDI